MEDVLSDLRRYREESGTDEQMDLRVIQAIPVCDGGLRTMRTWFNDGRIRDFDFWPLIRSGENRYKELADESVFSSLMSVFGSGAPGFDFGGNHNENDCMDFDPYHIWANSTDVTEKTLADERAI